MSLYLDASFLMPIVILEAATTAVEQFLTVNSGRLVVSDFAAAEVTSAISRLVRTRKLTGEDAGERLADFDDWRAGSTDGAEMDPHDCRLATSYVRRFDLMLRAPDALHIAACRRLNLDLVTLDLRLARAAGSLGLMVRMPTGSDGD